MSNVEFINKLKEYEDSAWQAVVEEHYKGLLLFCGRFVKDESDAYAIVHDTYIKAKKNINSFNSEKYSSFRPWLWQIAKNIAINFINSSNKEKRRLINPPLSESLTTQLYLKIADTKPGPRTNVNMKAMYLDLYKALENIKPIFREIVMLRYSDKLSRKEIAEFLDISENTVKSRLRLALGKLRKSLPKDSLI